MKMFLGIMEYFPTTPLEIVTTILSSLAVVFFGVAAVIKNKNRVILTQSIAHVFLVFSETVSGAWSSVVQDLISLVRNGCVYFKKNTKKVNIILIVLACVIGIYANIFSTNFFTPWKGVNLSPWYGYLPVIANFEYSVVLLKKDMPLKWIKLSFAISCFLWGASFLLMGKGLILSGILNIITGIVSIISFISLSKKKDENE